jgi:uncharacterized membrane protein
MNLNSSPTLLDRVFAALPYLLPLADAFVYGYAQPLLRQFPLLQYAVLPLVPVVQFDALLISGIPFGSMVLFLILYFAIARNEKINRFIRFNVMQAILVDIILFICNLILPILAKGLQVEFVTETLVNTVFLGIVVVFGYGVVQSLRGLNAEIPAISDAANVQVR